jgi:hypothetical protein
VFPIPEAIDDDPLTIKELHLLYNFLFTFVFTFLYVTVKIAAPLFVKLLKLKVLPDIDIF